MKMSPAATVPEQPSVKPSPEAPTIPDTACTEKVKKETTRRKCGCMRTSEKLRNILNTFPQPPPPPTPPPQGTCKSCKEFVQVNSMGFTTPNRIPSTLITRKAYIARMPTVFMQDMNDIQTCNNKKMLKSVDSTHKDANSYDERPCWAIVKELITLIQLSVTATALAIYYLIYCYMQLIYYTLRSAVYFHQADASMKITITIVTITALILSIYFISRIETLLGFRMRQILHFI